MGSVNANDSMMPARKGLIKRITDYFAESNQGKDREKFDFGIIGGPHYSNNTKLGLGLVAAGLYYTTPHDTLMPPSNLSLYADLSTAGFYMIGLRGVHILPQQRYRWVYDVSFSFSPTNFWGTGYDMGNDDDNESKMDRLDVQVSTSFLFRLNKGFYVGPTVAYNWMTTRNVTRPGLVDNLYASASDIGAGLMAEYDTRDVMTAPHRGMYLSLTQTVRKQLFNRRHWFTTTNFVMNGYLPAWRGATVAAQLSGVLQMGRLSWNDLAMLGTTHSMRGYYYGRYRDRNKLKTQVELRQHIYRRNGMVAWVGAGTVFPEFSELRLRKVLPNYGVGYRWEFKKNVNIRIDYGFGKSGQSGFIFNIEEAF